MSKVFKVLERLNPIQTLLKALEYGGLAQIIALRGGPRTLLALSCLGAFLKRCPGPPPLSLWVSDEGFPYPPLLVHRWAIPLARFLLVKVDNPMDVWRVGLEAAQSGLFDWALLRPSTTCPMPYLRKLQLITEKTQSRFLLMPQRALPHWPLKVSVEVKTSDSTIDHETDYLHPKPITVGSVQRSVSVFHSQDLYHPHSSSELSSALEKLKAQKQKRREPQE